MFDLYRKMRDIGAVHLIQRPSKSEPRRANTSRKTLLSSSLRCFKRRHPSGSFKEELLIKVVEKELLFEVLYLIKELLFRVLLKEILFKVLQKELLFRVL